MSEDYTYPERLVTLVRPAELDACRRERDAMRADLAKCVGLLRTVLDGMTVRELAALGSAVEEVEARWGLGVSE